MLDRVLGDIQNQSADNLVDGLVKEEEEMYSYEHYYGTQRHQVFSPSFRYNIILLDNNVLCEKKSIYC